MKRLLALAALLPLALHAAVPQFTENIACGPVRLRLPKGVEATPMPALESYRFIQQIRQFHCAAGTRFERLIIFTQHHSEIEMIPSYAFRHISCFTHN